MEQESSPYQPPRSDVDVTPREENDIATVGRGVRFINYVIDYIAAVAIAVGLILLLEELLGSEVVAPFEKIPDLIFGAIIMTMYYLPSETLFGRTLGKLATGTRVVDSEGNKPAFLTILGRTLARSIPFEVFSFLKSDARGWHDTLSKTYVVKCR